MGCWECELIKLLLHRNKKDKEAVCLGLSIYLLISGTITQKAQMEGGSGVWFSLLKSHMKTFCEREREKANYF